MDILIVLNVWVTSSIYLVIIIIKQYVTKTAEVMDLRKISGVINAMINIMAIPDVSEKKAVNI